MGKLTAKQPDDKPSKPRADFPLFPHASGRWAKKVKGRFVYFGKVEDDPRGEAAFELWLDQKDDLYAGRKPRARREGLTLRQLVNSFLTAKKLSVDSGDLEPRSFVDYYATCERVLKCFGSHRSVADLRGDDFQELRKAFNQSWGPVTVGNEIQRVRVLFKFAVDEELIDKPVRYGAGFKRPSKKNIRRERNRKGKRMFDADQLKSILDAAGTPMKAMVLLGINAGYANTDVATLPLAAIDLDRGWVAYPRPKTEIQRRCPLWPETSLALREALLRRPQPREPDDDGLVFITRRGRSWSTRGKTRALVEKLFFSPPDRRPKVGTDDPVCKEFAKLIRKLKLHRPGLGFGALRHSFQTVGEQTLDFPAVDLIMGHAPRSDDMSDPYREEIGDDRLKAVTEHVRTWLFGGPTSGPAVDGLMLGGSGI